MSNGVLNDRLQNQAWHSALHQLRSNVDARGQAIFETHALNAEIELDQIQFFLQRNFLAIVVEVGA